MTNAAKQAKANKTATIALFGDNEIAKESTLLAKALTGAVANRVQKYLLSEIAHIEKHRNPTRLCEFFRNVKGGAVRVSAMHRFIQAFANVKFVEAKERNKAGDMYAMQAKRSDSEAKAAFDKAASVMWNKFTPPSEPRDYMVADSAKAYLYRAFRNGLTFEEIEAALLAVKDAAEKEAKAAIAKAAKKAEKTTA